MEIHCSASPAGTPEDRYKHVEAAIGVVQQSGLTYEVGALGTTVEGPPDVLWPLARRVHDACLAAGANSVITTIRIGQAADPARQSTIQGLVGKFR